MAVTHLVSRRHTAADWCPFIFVRRSLALTHGFIALLPKNRLKVLSNRNVLLLAPVFYVVTRMQIMSRSSDFTRLGEILTYMIVVL